MFQRKNSNKRSYDDLDINSPLIFNLMPEQSGGHAILKQSHVEGEGLGGKTLTYGYPLDLRLKETMFGFEGEEEIKKEYSILTEPLHRMVFPKGQLSRYISIVWLIPDLSKSLPPEMSNTTIGNIFDVCREIFNVNNIHIKALREGSKTKDELLKDMNTGGKMLEDMRKQVFALAEDSVRRSINNFESPTMQPKKPMF